MRYLSIDYGVKRIGLAISDEDGVIAFPKETIKNDKNIFQIIGDILVKEKIQAFVIGDSRNADNSQNKISGEINEFISELEKKFGLKVNKEKEFFSSYEAHGRMGKESKNASLSGFNKTEDIDAKAAAIILQRYLDRKNKKL